MHWMRLAREKSRALGTFSFICLLTLAVPCPRASAHEGHDHGPPAPALPELVKPRVAIQTDTYELVGVASGDELTLFLDLANSNEPVSGAKIDVVAGSTTINAEARPDGTYRALVKGISKPGSHELIFNVSHTNGDDLLAGSLNITEAIIKAQRPVPEPGSNSRLPIDEKWWIGVLGLLAGLVLGFAMKRGGRMPVAALAIGLISTHVPEARAHEGHAPSPAPSGESFQGEAPRRLADGSVFLPKASQRLMSVRTELAIETEANRATTLVGRIISDPNRSGVVQSISGGRVSPPESGLPKLGQSVKQGDILASVTPAIPLADQSTIAEKQRELEGSILLAEQKLSRFSKLGPDVVARAQIDDIELEIQNLKKRLSILKDTKIQPEILTSPITGTISASNVVAGQVVQGQDILFQIVDPEALWVEALVFDQLDPGSISDATAIAPDGTSMRLTYAGRSRALKQQAVQLQFSIDKPPPAVALGQPVRVIARKAQVLKGMLFPRDAVVRGTGGEMVVWQHLDPERFIARPVRVEPYDGEAVLITAGISPKDRIVVHGAELLAQVR